MPRFIRLLCFSLIVLSAMNGVVGCRKAQLLLKADPAPDSGYVENANELKPMRERAPLHKLWFKDREGFYASRDKYKKIHFRPVRTDFFLARGWWDKLNTVDRAEYEKDVREMADYIGRALREEFTDDPKKRLLVVETVDPETIVYEFALTELRATKVHVNLASSVLGAVVPGGGLLKMAGTGSIAVEVKAFDGATNDLLLAWADREMDQSAPVTFRDYSFYAHARKAVRDWARQLVEIWNTPFEHRVEDSSPVTLNPF